MKRYLIETEQYVASCEFDTQEQFDQFLEVCQQECEDINALINERIETGGSSAGEARYVFEYRDDMGKSDADLRREYFVELDDVSYRLIWTRIYPESVPKTNRASFFDKKKKWNKRHEYYAMDKDGIKRMQQYLDRAEQIREDKRAKNTAAETSEQSPNIADYPRMTQAATGVGVPDTIESYQENIEESDGTVPNVHDEKVLKAIENNTAVLNEIKKKISTGEPRPVYHVPTPKDVALEPQNCPVEGKNGFWMPQNEYAKRVGLLL